MSDQSRDASPRPGLRDSARQALAELDGVFATIRPETADALIAELLRAGRIACAGAGREGLMIRAFCMRLMHLGLDAHMTGDVTTPTVGPGDLFIATVGTGRLPTIEALLAVARAAGARIAVITAQPDGPAPRMADTVIHVPAQTMADDRDGTGSILPMGTLFEIAELIFFDLVALTLRDRTNQSSDDVRARHTNLE